MRCSKDNSHSKTWTPGKIATLIRNSGAWPMAVSDQVIERLYSPGRISRIAAGKQLSRRTQPPYHFSIILSGEMTVSADNAEGRVFLVSVLEPGSYFGLVSCLDNVGFVHNVVPKVDSDILSISATDLKAAMQSDPETQDVFVRLLCFRLRLSYDALEQFAIWTPRSRLAARLIGLRRAYGIDHPEGIRINTYLPQESLAAMVSLSRQRTNTILKDFERNGLIRIEYGYIIILNLRGLQAEIASNA